ncbi:hypothetical protein [Aquimarina muelleri]|uniref:Uncharacterized protein n=1 Tax=Aquimarina muelleri TaxID=279356 RepID=A0A918N5U8_9FLAO|nr:hypothetical protein [Aquimarina muelleri]MCX2764750.1 hypothetical protein [Aquimarina muelleri]GGX33552.1 hypothetical protein GCM10007384_37790 [Aquimarina muelleri]
MKKTTVILIIISLLFLVFFKKCTLINLNFTTQTFKNPNKLTGKIQSKNYEIVPVEGNFPILFDSIKSEFYLKNYQGLTKIDAEGNILISEDLLTEDYTSVFNFENFIPYVFTKNGVYDFSGEKLIYTDFSIILNSYEMSDEMSDDNFKSIFEAHYKNAELVIYESYHNFNYEKDVRPMYFKIDNEWVLLFSQILDDRFSDQIITDNREIIGRIDYENFSAKFGDKTLIVLKNSKTNTYSLPNHYRFKFDTEYLNDSYEILNEQKLNYQSNNEIKMVYHKKEGYLSQGRPWNIPDWFLPSFLMTGYFELNYENENLFFKETVVQHFSEINYQNNLYLYELPKKYRKKVKISFLDYNLNIGGTRNDSTGVVDPKIKSVGLYMIKPK